MITVQRDLQVKSSRQIKKLGLEEVQLSFRVGRLIKCTLHTFQLERSVPKGIQGILNTRHTKLKCARPMHTQFRMIYRHQSIFVLDKLKATNTYHE